MASVSLEEGHRLQEQWRIHVTIGEVQREMQHRHRGNLLDWLHKQFLFGIEPDLLYQLFAA